MKRLLYKLTLLIFSLALVQCGNNDNSQKVDLIFEKQNPIVIPSDYSLLLYKDPVTLLPVTETITGPWFQFKYSITNGTSKELIIQTLVVKVTGISTAGAEVTAEAKISVTDLLVNKDSDTTNDRLFLEDVLAGKVLQASQMTLGVYIGSLPTPTMSTVFNVEIEAIGWFGAIDAPSEKFSKKFYLTTQ